MQLGKVFCAESLAQTDRDGQGVTEGQHGGGGSSRREIQAAGLALHAAVESYIAGLGEGRVEIAAEADQRVALALEGGEQAQNFFRLAADREGHHRLVPQKDAPVAVSRLGRME